MLLHRSRKRGNRNICCMSSKGMVLRLNSSHSVLADHYLTIFMSTCLDVCVAACHEFARTSVDSEVFCNSLKCDHLIHAKLFVTDSTSHTRSGYSEGCV